MKLSARTVVLYSATFAGLLMLSACGKNEPQTAAPAAASTAAAPAAASTATTPAAAGTTAAPAPPASAPTPAPASTATPPAAAAAPTAAPAPAATADVFKVATVTLGDTVNAEHKVRKAMTSFTPNQKTLYASVATEGHADTATLSAKWSYLEGKGQLVTTTSQSIAADGPAVTTFKVQNPNLWPEGKYKVEILLDGKQVASQDFEIKQR